MLVPIRSLFFPALAVAFLGATAPVQPDTVFPPLAAETAGGWRQYAAAIEQRTERELKAPKGFLALDFGASAAADRQAVLSGQMPVTAMTRHGAEWPGDRGAERLGSSLARGRPRSRRPSGPGVSAAAGGSPRRRQGRRRGGANPGARRAAPADIHQASALRPLRRHLVVPLRVQHRT